MANQILFVDDEPDVLRVLERQAGHTYDVVTAVSGALGLKILRGHGPFAVVVANYRMPKMDGIQFLAAAETIVPDTVRMMLTGTADMNVAIEAVNAGHLYRFLTKPCPTKKLLESLQAGVEQYRVLAAERALLENTLRGSIKILTEILSLVNPAAFSRASRIKPYVRQIANWLNLPNVLEFELAAMLSQIGCVTLPPAVLKKVHKGIPLTPDEQKMYSQHPKIGANLIRTIPRLERIADIVRAQQKPFHRSAKRVQFKSEDRTALGGYILKVALEFEQLLAQKLSVKVALRRMRRGDYIPETLDALENLEVQLEKGEWRSLGISELEPGMILYEDVFTTDDVLLASRGEAVTDPMIGRLHNFSESIGVFEPIRVVIPRPPIQTTQKVAG